MEFLHSRVRYFTYNPAVVKEVLGDEFVGVLVSDFDGGCNIYDGVKQRCWIHYIRDLKALAEKYALAAPWVDYPRTQWPPLHSAAVTGASQNQGAGLEIAEMLRLLRR